MKIFPQHIKIPLPAPPAPESESVLPSTPERLSARLLGDLAQLCRVESKYAKSMDDFCWLQWISEDLTRRWRKARR